MTDTSAASAEPDPPQDYGNGDTWADDGPYAVPLDLRTYYADAEPPPVERAGYIQNGAQITETRTREVDRVLSPGTFDTPPVVVSETEEVDCLVDISGPRDYRTWLHLRRLRLAEQAKRRADSRTRIESQYSTCPVCQLRAATVRTDYVRHAGAKVSLTGCVQHLPVLLEAARAELVTSAADQTLPDGRRVGDVAAELVAAQLDQDGAA